MPMHMLNAGYEMPGKSTWTLSSPECFPSKTRVVRVYRRSLQFGSPSSRNRPKDPHAPRTTDQHWHCPTSKGTRREYQRLLSRFLQPCNYHQLRKSRLEKLLPNRRIPRDIICFGSRCYRAPRGYLTNHPFTLLR
jgi:hypothetical protein